MSPEFLDGYRDTSTGAHYSARPAVIATALDIIRLLGKPHMKTPGIELARGIAAGIIGRFFGVDLSGGLA